MALRLARVVIIRALQFEVAENPLHGDGLAALALLPGFCLVGGVDALDGLLEQPTDQGIGRFENGGAHQQLQLGHGGAVSCVNFVAGDQLLDFLFLGEEERRREWFFFASASCWRVSAMTRSAYCAVSC